MWFDQDEYDNCIVCNAKLMGYKYFLVCPKYHYSVEINKYSRAMKHSIYLVNIINNEIKTINNISWVILPNFNKYCLINWDDKDIKTEWLELSTPINLINLNNRIKNLLLFL